MIEIFFVDNLTLVFLEESKNELVKENPLLLEKLIEKVPHIVARDN